MDWDLLALTDKTDAEGKLIAGQGNPVNAKLSVKSYAAGVTANTLAERTWLSGVGGLDGLGTRLTKRTFDEMLTWLELMGE